MAPEIWGFYQFGPLSLKGIKLTPHSLTSCPVCPSVEFRQKYAELAVNFSTLDNEETTSSFIRASTPQDDVTCDDILTVGVLELRSGTSTHSHCFVEMDEVITFVFHHGGTFVTKDDGEVVYEMGEITELPNEEVDTLDVFSIRNHHKVLGYDKIKECYWLVPGRSLSNGLRALITDNELLEMCFYAERNERRIHIYYEHAVSVPNPVEECPKLIEMQPSTIPEEDEAPNPIMVDIISDSEIDLPPKSPCSSNPKSTPNQKPNPTKQNPHKEIPSNPQPNPPKHQNTNISAAPQYATANSSNPKSNKPGSDSYKSEPKEGEKIVQNPTTRGGGSNSSDSDEIDEDHLYIPKDSELSSEDDDDFMVTQARKRDNRRKHAYDTDLRKVREEIMLEDDGLVVDDSDSNIDLGKVFGDDAGGDGDQGANDGDSDGNESWESLEMRTPPNSEDEENVVDDALPIFRE
ncbi:hypothetical protein PIB30_075445 [Stylosanthes scabra]|uniref:PB1-like domain-containing protein n=1 Tax=Stylosanthes scabra TaxID=79078 RepID=A0ABU6WN96_9FABA|nr:hypothetical protein [Stylosanthes scabra]